MFNLPVTPLPRLTLLPRVRGKLRADAAPALRAVGGEIALAPVFASEVASLSALLEGAVPECAPLTVWQLPYEWSRYVAAKRRDDGRLLGAASLQPLDGRRTELRGLVIAPDARGSGIATRLVRHLLAQADARGVEVVCVTRRPSFFRRLGFRDAPPSWLTGPRLLRPRDPSDPLPPRVSMARAPRRWTTSLLHLAAGS